MLTIIRIFGLLSNQHLTPYLYFKDQLREIFETRLIFFINSAEFEKQLFDASETEEKGQCRLNPSKYYYLRDKTPFAAYGGGMTHSVLSNYHNQLVITEQFPLANCPLMVLDSLVTGLSEQQNEMDLLMCSTGSHAFNLLLQEIKQTIISPGIKDINKKLKDSAEAMGKIAITADIASSIISNYTNNQSYPDGELEKLHYKILSDNVTGHANLDDLCHAIAATDRELTGENRQSVREIIDGVIRIEPYFQNKLPPSYRIANTNWESRPHLVLSSSVLDKEIYFGLRSPSNQPQIMSWSPGDMWRWSMFRFPSGVDTLSRTYLKRKSTADVDDVKMEPIMEQKAGASLVVGGKRKLELPEVVATKKTRLYEFVHSLSFWQESKSDSPTFEKPGAGTRLSSQNFGFIRHNRT